MNIVKNNPCHVTFNQSDDLKMNEVYNKFCHIEGMLEFWEMVGNVAILEGNYHISNPGSMEICFFLACLQWLKAM